MKCAKCDAELEPSERFCGECGAESGPRIERRCPSCGAINRSGKRFCVNCGKPLDLPGQDPRGYEPRWHGVTLNELIGWPEKKVMATLGPPGQRSPGDVWRSSDGKCIGVNSLGKVEEIKVWGPVPGDISPL